MAKKKHKKDPGKKQKASRSAQGKQRQERRDGWTTRRRQVTATPYTERFLIWLTFGVSDPLLLHFVRTLKARDDSSARKKKGGSKKAAGKKGSAASNVEGVGLGALDAALRACDVDVAA
ncbi:hypothetical protein HaLaN_14660, partial [Haematococcus lacustris]